MFYDYNKVYSYNALLNFIIGERGVGKTYGAIKSSINRFIKHQEEFVYVRRYKTELKKFHTLIAPLLENEEFKGHSLKIKNKTIYVDDKPCGYGMELSTALTLKSSSFPKVKTIIYDEFIIDKGVYHYLPNEVENFLDLVETLSRLRDVRIILLGNAVSIINPYFTYFNLSLPYGSDIKLFKDGLILVNYIKNEEYRKAKKETRFGKLIEGTNYGLYAIDNQMLRDTNTFIKKKTSNSKFLFIISINNNEYGVWKDFNEQFMYVSKDLNPNCKIKIATKTEDHQESTLLLSKQKNKWLIALTEHYKLGKLAFENQQIKNELMEVIKKYCY